MILFCSFSWVYLPKEGAGAGDMGQGPLSLLLFPYGKCKWSGPACLLEKDLPEALSPHLTQSCPQRPGLRRTPTSPWVVPQGDSPFPTHVSVRPGALWGFSETLAGCCLQPGASDHPFSLPYFYFSGFSLSSLLLAGISLSFASWA